MQNLLKKLYADADIDFLIREGTALTNIEFKQTFREYRKAAEYTYELLQKEGIEAEFITFPADGRTVYQDFRTPLAWEATKGSLTVIQSPVPFEDPVLADYERHPFHLIKGSTGTPPEGVKALLLTEEQVLAGADATGAIVLLAAGKFARSGSITPMLDRGAIGFISACVGRGMEQETPDCLAWCNAATDDHAHWHVQCDDRPFLGFSVTPRTGEQLREACALGAVEVLAVSDGRRYEGEIYGVSGYVRGKSEKEIWLIAHLFEPFFADNCVSVIMAMEVAKQVKRMGTPNFSLRLVFSAETYGLAAMWDHYKDRLRGKVLGGLDIDTPPAYTFDKNFATRFNPYCSPFFGNNLFLKCAEVYEAVFPNLERCAYCRTQYGDDLIMGDPTIGIPTVYFEEADCWHWHSSYWIPERVEPDKLRRSFAFVALWSVMAVFLDEESIEKLLPDFVRLSQGRLDALAHEENTRQRMGYFLRGEQAQILSFARAVDFPGIHEAAGQLRIAPQGETVFDYPALENVRNLVPQRATEGFPYDLARLPYEKRRALPNGVIYGAFATVLAMMDGRKTLDRIITEAAWEHRLTVDDNTNHFVPLSNQLIQDYIDAIYYLADAGYLTLHRTTGAPCAE